MLLSTTNLNPRLTSRDLTSSFDRLCAVEADAGAAGGGGGAASPQAPPPPADAGAGGAGAGGEAAAFYESFTNEALKTNPTIQRFKTTQDLAEGYLNAEKRLGVPLDRHLVLPADPADKEAMNAIYAKLGMPEKVDGYGLALDPKTATEADKAFLGRALERMHGNGLSKDQAAEMFKLWQEEGASAQKAAEEATVARRAAGVEALKKEWGGAYDTRGKEIGALLNKLGGGDLAKALEGDKLADHPQLASVLGKVLDAMAEPGAPGGGSGDADQPGRTLTPAQATARSRELEAHPAFRDDKHPQHREIVRQRNDLLRQASPPT